MMKVLIAIDDSILCDIVKTAFKQFRDMAAYATPPGRLSEFLSDSEYHAVVVLLPDAGQQSMGEIAAIRAINPSIEILALMEKNLKEKTNRLKVELGIFSYVSLPLDPFEFVRRIARLENHIRQKLPVAS